MFLIGVAGFTLASLACGAAGSAERLIAARVAQGAAGAIMAPQVLTMIQLLYNPVERISRLAWSGVVGGLSAISGPILGGILIAADIGGLGWRAVFLIMAVLGRRLAATAGKWLIIGGVALLVIFYGGILTWVALDSRMLWTLLPLVLVAGAGMGMVIGPIAPVAVSRVNREHAGAASGILKTVQQTGGAFGFALAGGAFFAVGAEQRLAPAIVVIEALLVACAPCAIRLPHEIFAERPDASRIDVASDTEIEDEL